MDPDRWRRVNDLFHAALEHGSGEREAFLAEACGDDDEVRAEVTSLLAAHDGAGHFIDRPAFEGGAELLHGGAAAAPATPLVGRRLGPYRIGDSIGYGGMGVVYLAEDTRLDRRVAIKALAGHLVRDARSRERLRREARAAAALSHPGVATVFALEEFDGDLYIVYEYAEGPTLREELANGALPIDRVIDTALAIARALEAAHDLGIVHRDLKPENVVRTKDGGIKILDFGLASFQAPPDREAERAGGNVRLTLPGMLLGTPSYMAPEQLRGQRVDFRADLFSFGVLLYEMATGVHPFEGEDPASTIARILEVEAPAVDRLAPPEIGTLSRVLEISLHKDPADRYRSTAELVADLERLATSVPSDIPSRARDAPQRLPKPARPPRHDAFWWWRFHQVSLAVVYGVSFYGLWWINRSGAMESFGVVATLLAFAAVVPVMVAGSLRLHLAFTARYYPSQLSRQRLRSTPLIRAAELIYALLLVGGALPIARQHPLVAVPLFAAAIGILVVGRMVEPTTARAAFPGD